MSRSFFSTSGAERQKRLRAANQTKLLAAAVESSDEESPIEEKEILATTASLHEDSFISSSFPSVQDLEKEEPSEKSSYSTSSEDSEVEIDELLQTTDSNRMQKIYEGSRLSIYDASRIILKLVRRLNLDKNKTNILLHTAKTLLPDNNRLPRTLKGLTKILRTYFSLEVS